MWRSPEAGPGAGPAPGTTRVDAPAPAVWCDHTARVPEPTGVQRVVRGLLREMQGAEPVGWDRWRRVVRTLSSQERHALGLDGGAPSRRRGPGGWLFVPETPSLAMVDGADPIRMAHAMGWRAAALVHDLIPVMAPTPYPPEVSAWYRAYLRSLARADLLFVSTRHVAGQLRGFLSGDGLRVPPIAVVPLAAELPGVPRAALPATRAPGAPLRLLTVSRWEPRKNLPRLLDAVDLVRAGGRDVRLTLVGRRGGFAQHEAELEARLACMPWVEIPRRTPDAALPGLYADHDAAVYPSLDEGFGLPVLESLWCGRPCLYHDGSAMAEVAPGGGTLGLDMADEAALAAILVQLFDRPERLASLADEASCRPLRRWADVAADIRAMLAGA